MNTDERTPLYNYANDDELTNVIGYFVAKETRQPHGDRMEGYKARGRNEEAHTVRIVREKLGLSDDHPVMLNSHNSWLGMSTINIRDTYQEYGPKGHSYQDVFAFTREVRKALEPINEEYERTHFQIVHSLVHPYKVGSAKLYSNVTGARRSKGSHIYVVYTNRAPELILYRELEGRTASGYPKHGKWKEVTTHEERND